MWFKNAVLYRVELDGSLRDIFNNPSLLEERIAALRFKSAGALETQSTGFTPVLGRKTEAFTFSFDHNHFFRICEENKLMPPAVVKQAVEDEIDNLEQEKGAPLSKNEKQNVKIAVTQRMLARAFSSRRELMIHVNSKDGLVFVSVSSAKRAENAITLLRKALESFPAKPLQPRCVVEERLTSFVTGTGADLPPCFTLGSDTVLKSGDETGATVRISKEELTTDEVTNHIRAGKFITDLQLGFENSASFVLSQTLSLKRISLEDQYLEKNLPQQSGDDAADLQGFLIVQADVLNRIAGEIIKTFDC